MSLTARREHCHQKLDATVPEYSLCVMRKKQVFYNFYIRKRKQLLLQQF